MTGQRSSFVLLLAAAGLAASQSLSSLGLSQQCQSTLTSSLLGNSDISKCLNVGSAISIFTTSANTSIVQPVDNWLKGVCSAAPCSNDTIRQAAQNITSNCQSDLNSIGITSDDTQNIVDKIVQFYPTVRKVACLQDNGNSSKPLCVTELLTNIQNVIGPLSTNNIVSTFQGILSGDKSVNIPKDVVCNDCTQAAWAIIRQDVPDLASNKDVTDPIQSQCGSDFLNAAQPSDVSTAGGASTTGAAPATIVSLGHFAGVAAIPVVGLLAGGAILL